MTEQSLDSSSLARKQLARDREHFERKASYRQYRESDRWKAMREAAVRAAGFCCMVCASADRLEVHHRFYRGPNNERPGDLTVLCHDCHALFHKFRRIT